MSEQLNEFSPEIVKSEWLARFPLDDGDRHGPALWNGNPQCCEIITTRGEIVLSSGHIGTAWIHRLVNAHNSLIRQSRRAK